VTSVTGDVIATASLLLAVIAAIFSLWYSEIEKAIGVDEPDHKGARLALRNEITPTVVKAVPLAAVATLIAAVFLPRTIAISVHSFRLLLEGPHAWRYDDLMMAFLLTEVILVLLAGLCMWMGCKLVIKWNSLRSSAD